jgi:hypothetical protein
MHQFEPLPYPLMATSQLKNRQFIANHLLGKSLIFHHFFIFFPSIIYMPITWCWRRLRRADRQVRRIGWYLPEARPLQGD